MFMYIFTGGFRILLFYSVTLPVKGISMLRSVSLCISLVILFFVSCTPGAKFETPLEETNYAELTSYESLFSYVVKLDRRSDLVTMDTLGYSVEGRMIPYLKITSGTFGEDRLNKLIVLLFAQQHGNEPSGKEAVLALARDFVAGRHNDLLEHLDILLVPQVNPDGSELYQRRNADNVDLNRSHLILNAPETIALRNLFHRWEPYVTVDIHEYLPWSRPWIEEGYIKLFDEQFGLVTNLNTDETIRLFSEHEFLPYAEREITAAGYTFHNYLVGTPERIRYSTTSVNDGRQGFGILNTFSLILEGKNARTPTEDIRRRTEAQQHALLTLLNFCKDKKMDILSIVRSARRTLIATENPEFVLTMRREKDSGVLTIPVLEVVPVNDDYETGDTVVAEIGNYFPLVVKEETTTIPDAYLVPATEDRIIELLRKHNILMKPLTEGDVYRGEFLVIRQFRTIELEETEILFPDLRRERATYIARNGDMLVPTDQLQRFLIATALEPQSMHGLLQYNEFRHLQQTGRYPIVRVELPDVAGMFD
jgi:hypothetical protein